MKTMRKIILILMTATAFTIMPALTACNRNNGYGYNNGANGTTAATETEYNNNNAADYDNNYNNNYGNYEDYGNNGNVGDLELTPDTVSGNPDPELVTLIARLYEGVEYVPISKKIELTPVNFSRYLFINYIEGARGVISKSLTDVNGINGDGGEIAHTVILLELPEAADAEDVAAEIRQAIYSAEHHNYNHGENGEKLSVFSCGRFVVVAKSLENIVYGIGYNVNSVLG